MVSVPRRIASRALASGRILLGLAAVVSIASCNAEAGDGSAETEREGEATTAGDSVKECNGTHLFSDEQYGSVYSSGPSKHMISADVDGDGHRDLVAAGGDVVVYVNHATSLPGGRPLRSGPRISDAGSFVAATDWNRDGRLDLVAVSDYGDLKLFEQDGHMTFVQVAEAKTHHAYGIAVADMTGDGRDEIVVYGVGITVWAAPGADGRLGEPLAVVDASRAARGGTVADVDQDGNPDVIVVSWNPDELLMVAHGNGRGGFEETTWYPSPSPGLVQGADAAVADLDGDGRQDIVVAGRSWPQDQPVLQRQAQLVWMRGVGNRQLEEAAVFAPRGAHHARAVSLEDIDHDGLPEIITYAPRFTYYRTSNGSTETFEIPGGIHLVGFRNGGLETVAPGFLETATNHGSLLVMDVNGDGLHDLLHMSGRMHLWWGCR